MQWQLVLLPLTYAWTFILAMRAIEGTISTNFWDLFDHLSTAIIYWILLSANLFTHSLHQITMDTKVEWVSSNLVRPSSIVNRLSLTRLLTFFIDLVLRILLTFYLMGLIGGTYGTNE